MVWGRDGTCCSKIRLSLNPGVKGAPSPIKAPIIVIARSKMPSSCSSVGAAAMAAVAQRRNTGNARHEFLRLGIFEQHTLHSSLVLHGVFQSRGLKTAKEMLAKQRKQDTCCSDHQP